uniref:Uncharacterized protein n=2 Tax=Aliivibrio wodanis TaxID=80852 RepID=A0A5Q4ZYT4_9GAMM|nr:hypothetical protein AW0309160_04525 [Aliivibrio wodanis]
MKTKRSWPPEGFRSPIEFRDCSMDKLVQLNKSKQIEANNIHLKFGDLFSEQLNNKIASNYHHIDNQGNDAFYMRMESNKDISYATGDYSERPSSNSSYVENTIHTTIEGSKVKTAQQYIEELREELAKAQAELELELGGLNQQKQESEPVQEQINPSNNNMDPSRQSIKEEEKEKEQDLNKNASNPTIGQLIAAAIHNKRNQSPKSTNSTNFPLKNALSESIPEQCIKMQALVSQIASPSSLTKEELAKKTNEFKNSAIKLGQSIMSEVKQGLFMNDNNKLAHMEKLKKDLECVQPLLDHINKKAPELNKLFEKSGIDLNADSISTKLKDITNQVKQSLSTMITALSRNGSEIGMKL